MSTPELIVYVNGEYLPRSQARIDPFDYGWRRGWVVYDVWAVIGGSFFKMDSHLERLWHSLNAAKIVLPMSKETVKKALIESVRQNGLRDAVVSMYVSYGVPTAGGYNMPSARPTVIITVAPFFKYGGDKVQESGMKVIISSVRAIPAECIDPRLKHVNRLPMNLADIEAKAANVDAPIMLNTNGYVTENNFANVFIVKNGKIYTPSEGVLGGITKEVLFEIAQREGIPAAEAGLLPYDLYNADEVFFSSSVGFVIPITEIGGRKIGNGKPGPLTRRLFKLCEDMVQRKEYCTPVYD